MSHRLAEAVVSQRRPWFALALLLVIPVTARGDDYSEFRIPAHRTFIWNGSLGAAGDRFRSDGVGGFSKQGRVAFSGASSASWLWDSDPALTEAGGFFGAAGNWLGSSSRFESPPGLVPRQTNDERRHDRVASEAWNLSLTHRRYPWEMPVGFSLDLSGTGTYAQDWTNRFNHSTIEFPTSNGIALLEDHAERWDYQTDFDVRFGVGYGRVRDATPVDDARVLEKRLLETGALVHPLSHDARQKLVALMATREAFDSVHDRPGRTLWQEIERVLAEDGALREGGLDAYSILRATEPISPRDVATITRDAVPRAPIQRQRGWFIGPNIEFREVRVLHRQDSGFRTVTTIDTTTVENSDQQSSRFKNVFDLTRGGISGDYHRPLAPRWQLDATSLLATGLRKVNKELTLQSSVQLSYIVSDHWLGAAFVNHFWSDEDRTQGPTANDRWAWTFGVSADYFIEDHIAIGATLQENQNWTRGAPNYPSGFPSHSYDRRDHASIGVSYRFAGWFRAPGLYPGGTAMPQP
jgi:hypothetical protein